MQNKFKRTIFIFNLLFLTSLLLGGCASGSSPSITTTQPTLPPDQASTTEPVADDVHPTASPTPNPVGLFIDEALPDTMSLKDLPAGFHRTSDPGAPLWFGPESAAPAGETLYTAAWVYALAAPFPTLVDSVTLNELRGFWQGYHPGGFKSVSKLYLPEAIAAEFEQNWGPVAGADIFIYSTPPENDTLWNQNAWAVLPFELLHPKLKVIQVDGSSPLHKGFQPQDYPLTLQYALVHKASSKEEISEEKLEGLIISLPAANRDPDKMTTLVMTGVTALVRATAERMETKGVLYPSEKILPWLVEADLTHISNEVSFYEDCPEPDPNSRSLFFCSDPKYIELLEHIGADIIELTGNHNNDILQREGKYLVPYNLKLYKERGMVYYGGGIDLEDARKPLTMTHNGNRLAFIGCNAPGPRFAWANQYRGGAAPCGDYQWMADEIQRLTAEGYLVIATFQYYEDYYNFAETHHLRDYGFIAEAGAVILNGSQAHRPKAMAFMGETLVDFGLGNLFFDQMGYTDIYGNNLQQVRWEKIQRHTFYDGRHLSTEILTAMLEDYAQPRPMTSEERQAFLEEIFSASQWNSR
jgi:hypothetical protein